MSDIHEIISERIHDADTTSNENMVHWLHKYVKGEITEQELRSLFLNAYQEDHFLKAPWQVNSIQDAMN